MRRSLVPLLAAAALSPLAAAQKDSFQREGERELKDQLEGKPAPALQVESWLNAQPLDLASLRGKVVVIDFWGTW